MRRTIIGLSVALAALLVQALPSSAIAQTLAGTGVVLMHGKTGKPDGNIRELTAALRQAGATVVTPEMPWAGGRIYDASYEQAMTQIESAAAELRKRGAKKIVIAGQSLGANAAIGYGVRHDDIAAVVAIAPGHNPSVPPVLKHTQASVDAARKLESSGQGNTLQSFVDVNQGKVLKVRATAKNYLSYLDPNGPAVMDRNAAAMKPVPFLLAIGREDAFFPRARDLYAKAGKSAKSKFVEVGGGHGATPRLAAGAIVAWLKSL